MISFQWFTYISRHPDVNGSFKVDHALMQDLAEEQFGALALGVFKKRLG